MPMLANLASLFGMSSGSLPQPRELQCCSCCDSSRVTLLGCSALGVLAWCQECGTLFIKESERARYVAMLPKLNECLALDRAAVRRRV